MKRCCVLALAWLAGAAGAAEFDARIQWYSTLRWLPEGGVLRDFGVGDHGADLRLMWREDAGDFRFSLDHSTTRIRYDLTDLAVAPGLTFDQTPTGDVTRAMRLSWVIDRSDKVRAWHRIDRVAVEYRRDTFGVTVGRQAITWGAGIIFQPFDLFNPFAPTTVARDYKPGDDLALMEKLFDDGSELQILGIARRSVYYEDISFSVSSLAAKYRRPVGGGELELMSARHRGETVHGVGLRIPLGGALLRSDVTATRLSTTALRWDDARWRVSGLVNIDYGFALFEHTTYVFAEYYRNGFGVEPIEPIGYSLSPNLVRRVVDGEVFNIGRDYLALGGQIQWHALLNHGISWIRNLNDGSHVLSTNLIVDAGNRASLQIGIIHPFGDDGDEYGEGIGRGYLRIVYYF